MIDNRKLFICSCIALITSAFTFSLHGNIMKELGADFGFTEQQNGAIGKAIFWGMAAAMLVGGFVCDAIGMNGAMYMALLSHVCGAVGMVYARTFLGEGVTANQAFNWLWWSGFIMGAGNGWTEVGINPLVATLYPREKIHYLNILHAWWPGGLIIGGLSALAVKAVLFTENVPLVMGLNVWQFCLGLILIPAAIYGVMLIGTRFPESERVAAGVSSSEMTGEILRPAFWLWMFCMLLTAATELGPQKWQESVMQSTANLSGTMILVYTSGMMFVLRQFAGPIAHSISPVGLLTGSALLSGVGLYLLSYAHDATTAFTYATIFGLGIAYFWPTMLGVAAERFPKGGALVLALMGTAGNVSIGFALDEMGRIADDNGVRYVLKNADEKDADLLLQTKDEQYVAIDAKKIEVLEKEVKENENATESARLLKIAKDGKAVGFSTAFRTVSVLPVLLVVIFGGIFIFDLSRGGYKAELLLSREEEDELMSGGAQGPME